MYKAAFISKKHKRGGRAPAAFSLYIMHRLFTADSRITQAFVHGRTARDSFLGYIPYAF